VSRRENAVLTLTTTLLTGDIQTSPVSLTSFLGKL
jgi:hypothetical protein